MSRSIVNISHDSFDEIVLQHEYPEATARTVFRLFGHGSEALTMSTLETITGGGSSQSSGKRSCRCWGRICPRPSRAESWENGIYSGTLSTGPDPLPGSPL